MKLRPLFLLVLLTALLAGRAQAQVTNQTDVKTWRIWEGVFRTSNTYTNPSYDVQLKVIFTPPAGSGLSPITAYGFWDGIESSQSVFKVRTAFPTAPGASPWVWTWTSSCTGGGCNTDAVLNQSTPFSVNVTPSTGGHVLFSHGFLKVNTSGVNANRYLVNDDGTPFFWLGDTAWNASIRAISAASGATALDWENYVLDRKAKGFTVVQIALPVDYMDSKNDGITQPKDFQTPRQMPFTQGSGCGTAPIPNSCSQWNPEYWKNFEQKVRYANGQGLVVLVVGLAERIIESNPTYPTNADLLVNARNVVARLSGEFVVFSPGFDRLPGTGTGCTTSENDMTCRIKVVGQKIKDTSTRHMVVNHFGGSLAVTGMDPFIDEPWLDFQLFQSGSACSDATSEANQTTLITQRARTFALHLWNLTTSTGGHKPVVNGEAIYAGNMCKGKPWTVNFTAYRVRQTGYLSMLSGAVGYTFGVIGVFDWGLNGSIPWGPPTTPPPTPPTKGTDFPSNAQMQVMCKVFRSLPAWQQLMPDHNLIANNTTPGTPPPPLPDELLMVLARDVNNQFAVAYLPNNAAIKIETAGFSNFASWTKEWVDPRNGAISTATCLKQGISTIYRCDVPSTTVPGETADWVLRLGASPFTATTLCN